MILFVVLLEMLKLNVQGIAYRCCTMLYDNTFEKIKISVNLTCSHEVIDDISLKFGSE